MLPKRQWIRWSVGYLLLCQTQALSVVDRVMYGEWVGKSGDELTQTLVITQIAISFGLFYRGSRHWRSVRKGSCITLSLALFLICSAAWSVDPGATLRAGIQYFVFIIAAIGVAENLEGDDFMDLLALVCFLSAIASLVLLIVWPATAIGGYGDFRGAFPQKNPLGEAMSMGALACLHGLRASKRGSFVRIVWFVVITFVVVKSGSATSLLAILMFLGLGIAMQKFEMKGLITVLPVALVAIFGQGPLLEILGKDPTLTGRTEIWTLVMPDIFQRPLLGWGYAAFWTTNNPTAWKISDSVHWWVPQAHNGVLEILLSVGLVGAVFYIVLIVRTFSLSVQCMQTNERAMGITSFVSCTGVLLVGVSENVLLYTGAITSVFFISGFYCERALSMARQRRFATPSYGLANIHEGGGTHELASQKGGNVFSKRRRLIRPTE